MIRKLAISLVGLVMFSLGFSCATGSPANTTPDIGATVSAAVKASLPTATPTSTPNIEATIQAMVATATKRLPSETPASGPTGGLAPLHAFLADPRYAPTVDIRATVNAQLEVDNAMKSLLGVAYYGGFPDLARKYEPHDINALNRALRDIKGLTNWEYVLNVFDCSNMAALTQFFLANAGFKTVIVTGKDPNTYDGHAWVVVLLSNPSPEAIPIEATSRGGPAIPSKNLVWEYRARGRTGTQTYADYINNGWAVQDIYQAVAWAEKNLGSDADYNWWNVTRINQEVLRTSNVVTQPSATSTQTPLISDTPTASPVVVTAQPTATRPVPTPTRIPTPIPAPTPTHTASPILRGQITNIESVQFSPGQTRRLRVTAQNTSNVSAPFRVSVGAITPGWTIEDDCGDLLATTCESVALSPGQSAEFPYLLRAPASGGGTVVWNLLIGSNCVLLGCQWSTTMDSKSQNFLVVTPPTPVPTLTPRRAEVVLSSSAISVGGLGFNISGFGFKPNEAVLISIRNGIGAGQNLVYAGGEANALGEFMIIGPSIPNTIAPGTYELLISGSAGSTVIKTITLTPALATSAPTLTPQATAVLVVPMHFTGTVTFNGSPVASGATIEAYSAAGALVGTGTTGGSGQAANAFTMTINNPALEDTEIFFYLVLTSGARSPSAGVRATYDTVGGAGRATVTIMAASTPSPSPTVTPMLAPTATQIPSTQSTLNGVITSISSPTFTPGQTQSVSVTFANTGTITDHFRIYVGSISAGWTSTVTYREVQNVPPGYQATVDFSITSSRSGTATGSITFQLWGATTCGLFGCQWVTQLNSATQSFPVIPQSVSAAITHVDLGLLRANSSAAITVTVTNTGNTRTSFVVSLFTRTSARFPLPAGEVTNWTPQTLALNVSSPGNAVFNGTWGAAGTRDLRITISANGLVITDSGWMANYVRVD